MEWQRFNAIVNPYGSDVSPDADSVVMERLREPVVDRIAATARRTFADGQQRRRLDAYLRDRYASEGMVATSSRSPLRVYLFAVAVGLVGSQMLASWAESQQAETNAEVQRRIDELDAQLREMESMRRELELRELILIDAVTDVRERDVVGCDGDDRRGGVRGDR